MLIVQPESNCLGCLMAYLPSKVGLGYLILCDPATRRKSYECIETLHTSQLAEQTILQMHVYIKIKAEIKTRPHLA